MRPAERVALRLVADGDCLIWTGHVERNGYGKITIDERSHWVHRVAWEGQHGPIPDALTIDHLCRRSLCCNTAHMELVTRGENARRGNLANRRSHCPQGHPFDSANTIANGRPGWRRCRTCHATRERARKQRARAGA